MIDPQTKKLKYPVVQSPMAGCSNLPFRLVARRRGMKFCYFEMISANGLLHAGKKSLRLLETVPEDRPIGVQLVGREPESMARAAKLIEDLGIQYLDLNLGCPVRKVVSQGGGAALLADEKKVGAIFEKVLGVLKKIPLTVKIRKGFKDETGQEALRIAKIAEECGIAAITVHGRTQKQGYSGKADWEIIKLVKESVKIPVIGNGDVFSAEDALKMKEATGCDGVMIGRGSLGNPWIFSQVESLLFKGKTLPLPGPEDKMAAMVEHIDLEVQYEGEKRALLHMRKVGSWYLSGIPNAASFRRRLFEADNIAGAKKVLLEAMNLERITAAA